MYIRFTIRGRPIVLVSFIIRVKVKTEFIIRIRNRVRLSLRSGFGLGLVEGLVLWVGFREGLGFGFELRLVLGFQ